MMWWLVELVEVPSKMVFAAAVGAFRAWREIGKLVDEILTEAEKARR